MCEGIADELRGINLGDQRLNKRSVKVIEAVPARVIVPAVVESKVIVTPSRVVVTPVPVVPVETKVIVKP